MAPAGCPAHGAGQCEKAERGQAESANQHGDQRKRYRMGDDQNRQSRRAPSTAPCAPSAALCRHRHSKLFSETDVSIQIGRQGSRKARFGAPRCRCGGRRRGSSRTTASPPILSKHRPLERDRRNRSSRHRRPAPRPTTAPGRKPKLMCDAPSCDHNPPVGQHFAETGHQPGRRASRSGAVTVSLDSRGRPACRCRRKPACRGGRQAAC